MPELSPGWAWRLVRSPWPLAVLIGLFALLIFGRNLASEPFFADESAYLSQSYYTDLYLSGRWNDPAWLDYPAYDLPPVPKYLIGAALWLGGYKPPGPAEAHYWYDHTTTRFDSRGELTVARVPMVIVGALGCLAIYGIGVLAGGRKLGVMAALLLIANPLYRMHARRAMSDVPYEAFLLLSLFFGLWNWKRLMDGRSSRASAVLLAVASGTCAGLSILSKMSGLLSLMVLGAWVGPAIVVRGRAASTVGYAACVLVATIVAILTFMALDPFLTAHPTRTLPPEFAQINRLGLMERVQFMFQLRFDVSARQKVGFSHDALHTLSDKLAVATVQGFGRFGPFGPSHSDSTKRFELAQDRGVVVWLPWVALGAWWAAIRGYRDWKAGATPTSWAVLVHFAVAFSVVTLYLPMAWDRYLLPIQAPAALLAAMVLAKVTEGTWMSRLWRSPGAWVFFILLASYSYFWQTRDWNSASRLMLTYAVVDRGTVSIDGLENQTGDRAKFRGRFYSDKLPGFSLLAAGPYLLTRGVLRLPDFPRNVPGFEYWPADYWVTLATSGVLTALTGALLAGLARDLGCGPGSAALVGLGYGLATPAFAYATMSYGHQASAFTLLASFTLLWRVDAPRQSLRVGLAGFLAAYAAVIELQVGPVAAILGVFLLAQVILGRRRPSALGEFLIGAIFPTLLLLGYNQLAFGSPWDLGYFHHTTKEFAEVHSEKNPLGLRWSGLGRAVPLLWGRHRGLLFYAPVVSLVPLGLVSLAIRRSWAMAIVSAATMAAVFAVNVSYPEWTGGWSTGPRLLVPLLPFAMLAVAGLLANGHKWAVVLTTLLILSGSVLMLAFVAVGGRLPHEYVDPFFQVVWPLWRGANVPGWKEPFARNLTRMIAPGIVQRLQPGWKWLQIAPLIIAQGIAVVVMLRAIKPRPEESAAS